MLPYGCTEYFCSETNDAELRRGADSAPASTATYVRTFHLRPGGLKMPHAKPECTEYLCSETNDAELRRGADSAPASTATYVRTFTYDPVDLKCPMPNRKQP